MHSQEAGNGRLFQLSEPSHFKWKNLFSGMLKRGKQLSSLLGPFRGEKLAHAAADFCSVSRGYRCYFRVHPVNGIFQHRPSLAFPLKHPPDQDELPSQSCSSLTSRNGDIFKTPKCIFEEWTRKKKKQIVNDKKKKKKDCSNVEHFHPHAKKKKKSEKL